ncbi:DUF1294 domain-containing protein [Rubellimicrobium roseum]|uniref:DUF1294 domain-containing protein n=1 Tax=Rubellimicrobium roseum TaxID=687525 RepID=A0A5C4NFA1_9RHOB|nr:DUF1294 domain-containing protein [Rubellimicrobium roseum]TNC70988.1 DUF1294 domain-containing protein [Rubellimicrobium roseum]
MALVASYVVAVNLLAFGLFGIDKQRAVAGLWRVSEATLIGVALAGGWIGAKTGQRHFRHKTRKQPFARTLNAVGLLHLGLLVALAALVLSPQAEVDALIDRLAESLDRILPVLAGESGESDAALTAGPLPRRFGPGSGDDM